MPINIINALGEEELFSSEKVYRSALRVGASKKIANIITKRIENEVYPGMKTSEIFAMVKALLEIDHPKASLRYSLKDAMRKLGPTGFPFEAYVAEILRKMDYQTMTNMHLAGFCISDYEIDFVARKEKLIYIGECKYKNLPGEIVHLPDILSNHARFNDILKGNQFDEQKKDHCLIKTMVVTNTKFTQSSIQYGLCYDIPLWGWRYPIDNGLESLIEKFKLYPITILPKLEGEIKDILVSQKIMLVSDLLSLKLSDFSKKFRISEKVLTSLISDAEILLEAGDKNAL